MPSISIRKAFQWQDVGLAHRQNGEYYRAYSTQFRKERADQCPNLHEA